LVLSFSLPRADDIFRRGRAHPESICTCSNCSRFDSSLCPTAMLSPWWYSYNCRSSYRKRSYRDFGSI